jgi:SpoVK/Ycf46/Vps4 family AAA+-type ATPase
MITNFPYNLNSHPNYGLIPYYGYNNNQLVPYRPRNLGNYSNNMQSDNCFGERFKGKDINKDPNKDINKDSNKNINSLMKEYIEKLDKKIDELSKKEYMWLSFNINNLEDLIQVAKDYKVKYSPDYEYQLDLDLMSKMIPELESLNNMIGLKSVKNQIVDLILYYGLKLDNRNHDLLHTVIEGEPGTGKTELAEKLAKIYLKMGILKKDVFKKVKRSDLIAGYLGQTAIKTEKVLEECRGGVLFIDEAYSLGNAEGKDGRDSFSKECIDMLNQWLTENKSEFVCIIAGYKDDLTKSFFSYNTGLERRFPIRFSIESYSDEELAKIFAKKVKEFEWDINCINLAQIIKTNRKYFKFNGGDMEVLFVKSKIAHSKNLLKEKEKIKKVLTETDIRDGLKIYLENPEIKKRGENFISSIYI